MLEAEWEDLQKEPLQISAGIKGPFRVYYKEVWAVKVVLSLIKDYEQQEKVLVFGVLDERKSDVVRDAAAGRRQDYLPGQGIAKPIRNEQQQDFFNNPAVEVS